MTYQEDGRRGGRVSLVVAGVVVAFIVVAGVVVGIVLGTRHHDTATPTQAPSPSSSNSGSSSSETTSSACGGQVAYASTDDLNGTPQTSWASEGPVKLAYSTPAGPSKNDNGYRSCYSRTATGALFATYNAAQYCADANLAVKALPETVADGPGKASAVKAAQEISSPCAPLKVQGFRVASYDGTNATIYLLVTLPTGEQGAAGFDVVWQHGDWKIVVDSSGNNPIAATAVQSSSGYTSWGPSNG